MKKLSIFALALAAVLLTACSASQPAAVTSSVSQTADYNISSQDISAGALDDTDGAQKDTANGKSSKPDAPAQKQQQADGNFTVLDLSEYSEQAVKNPEKLLSQASYGHFCTNFDQLYEASDELIKCEVLKKEYIESGGWPFTRYQVEITESYKGSLKQGDIIYVAHNGGYVNMYDYVKANELESKYENVSEQKMKKQLVLMRSNFDETDPEQNETLILPLLKDESSTNPLPGAYWIVSEVTNIYRVDDNNKFTREYNTLKKSGEYKKDKNNIDSFTEEWLKQKLQSIKAKS